MDEWSIVRQVSRCDMTARLDDDDDPPVFLMNHEMQNILDSDPKWSQWIV